MLHSRSEADHRPPLEVWGGVECTVARIHDAYRNQTVETGHQHRLDDLDQIAALGIRTLRYPILWETVVRGQGESAWSWHDARLGRLRELGIRPIATLCHHGSGPPHTSLLDPGFAYGLAEHARSVAERYPWIEFYTPVNEPLTTARFSALYGHWYPHKRDYAAFLRAVLNQCTATVLAMRSVRRVCPGARLVQTEDLGKTFATPTLAYQAAHDNERRWLTFDLLCGRMTPSHALWGFFMDCAKIDPTAFAVFDPTETAPDIIGINHYLTGDRYLDERHDAYPRGYWGGNGRHRYADVEAVRADVDETELGPAARLREAWERYRRPMAVTEVHHGSTRDEQLRWLMEVWRAAEATRRAGADIRAITIWALFGAVDWNSLLTERRGIYEPGAFDIRGTPPRPTAIARAGRSLTAAGGYDHPVLDGPGWWRRDTRFHNSVARPAVPLPAKRARTVLITGATGTLGRCFSRVCQRRGLAHVLTSRRDLDIADPASIDAALARHRPWAVINTAGYVRVDRAEQEPDLCFRENAHGAEALARACAALGIPLVTFSSDLVFDGLSGPYRESDPVSPTNVYGKSKAEAERAVLSSHAGGLVVRTSSFFGPWDRYNFGVAVLRSLAAGRRFAATRDIVSPTYVPDLAHVTLDLLIDGEAGIWHLVNPGEISWAEFASRIAREAGCSPALVAGQGPARVLNRAMSSDRGQLLPPLDTTYERFLRDLEIPWRAGAAASVAAEV